MPDTRLYTCSKCKKQVPMKYEVCPFCKTPRPANAAKQRDGGALLSVLIAVTVIVGLFVAGTIGVGVWYVATADQRALATHSPIQGEAQPVWSQQPARVTTPEQTEPADTDSPELSESDPVEPPAVEPSPSAESSTEPPVQSSAQASAPPTPDQSTTPSANPPESQATASQPVPSNTPQPPVGNDRTSKFASGMVLATTESDNGGDPVYHTKNCRSAQKIDAGSELWYSSAQDAINDGRRICGNCDR